MITVNDVEYSEEDLTEEVKYLVAQVNDIDQKLSGLKFQADQLVVAKNAFSDAIVKSLQGDNHAE